VTAVLIPIRLRALVIARDAGRCAFCLSAECLMGVTFEIDHVSPRSAGGATTLDNLCLCCPTCNRHKSARTRASDPATGEVVRLFHPLRDAWEEHFEWRDGATLVAVPSWRRRR
jgi:5-methylcytosine-specific restriction endonuclease McrA